MTAPVRQTEQQFTDAVIGYAKLRGWRVAHFRPARTKHGWRTAMQGDKGFPDLVMARDGRVVFAELKRDRTQKARPEQLEWLSALIGDVEIRGWIHPGYSLDRSNVEVALWSPDDWDDIEVVLR